MIGSVLTFCPPIALSGKCPSVGWLATSLGESTPGLPCWTFSNSAWSRATCQVCPFRWTHSKQSGDAPGPGRMTIWSHPETTFVFHRLLWTHIENRASGPSVPLYMWTDPLCIILYVACLIWMLPCGLCFTTKNWINGYWQKASPKIQQGQELYGLPYILSYLIALCKGIHLDFNINLVY